MMVAIIALRNYEYLYDNRYTAIVNSPKFKWDNDAGPIFIGLSPSGTAFILGAATYLGDWEFRSKLLRTAEIAGQTKKRHNKRRYLLGEMVVVGEAVTLAMKTNIPIASH